MTALRLNTDNESRQLGNPHAEWIWRGVGVLVSAALSVMLAYAAVQREQATLEEREKNHYEEMKRTLGDMQTDVREIRSMLRGVK